MSQNLLELAQAKTGKAFQHAGGKHNGEYCGPCPSCGGTDRFRVWPRQRQAHGWPGGYWCRTCGLGGDVFQWLMDFEGMDFVAACRAVGRDLPKGRGRAPARARPPPPATAPPPGAPTAGAAPPPPWRERAEAMVAWAHRHLLQSRTWLDWLAARGISQEMAVRYRLGLNPGKGDKDLFFARRDWGLPEQAHPETGRARRLWGPRGLVIPWTRGGEVLRIRIRRPGEALADGRGKYIVIGGSCMGTWLSAPGPRVIQIIEAELDCIAMEQAAGDLCRFAGLGSLSMRPDRAAHEAIMGSSVLLDALDFAPEDDAKDQAQGPRVRAWWKKQYPGKYVRCPVPEGKDPGELIGRGVDPRLWIVGYLPPAMQMELMVGPSGPGQEEEGAPESVFEEAPGEGAARKPEPAHPGAREGDVDPRFPAGWERTPRLCDVPGVRTNMERRCLQGEVCKAGAYWLCGPREAVALSTVTDCPARERIVRFIRTGR